MKDIWSKMLIKVTDVILNSNTSNLSCGLYYLVLDQPEPCGHHAESDWPFMILLYLYAKLSQYGEPKWERSTSGLRCHFVIFLSLILITNIRRKPLQSAEVSSIAENAFDYCVACQVLLCIILRNCMGSVSIDILKKLKFLFISIVSRVFWWSYVRTTIWTHQNYFQETENCRYD